MLTFDDLLEAAHRVRDFHVAALHARELLGYVERLGEELLHFARPGNGQLILVGKLVDAKDGDDVLEVLVALEDALDVLGNIVVLLANDAGTENSRRGAQGIYGRIDSQFR